MRARKKHIYLVNYITGNGIGRGVFTTYYPVNSYKRFKELDNLVKNSKGTEAIAVISYQLIQGGKPIKNIGGVCR